MDAPVVLFADDNTPIRGLMVRAFAQAGIIKVVAAADGVEALAAFEADGAGEIGLLITDLMMPRLDGAGLIAKARAARPALKIILISTDPLPLELRDGGISYMQKPFLPSELVAKALELLG
ncbi:MAG: response regulator [Elusimicrobia bacterium]|nr:response regulator [Elusimicrobiota bacterium]